MSEISALANANTLAHLSLPIIQVAVIPPTQEQLISLLPDSTDTVTISPKATTLQGPRN